MNYKKNFNFLKSLPEKLNSFYKKKSKSGIKVNNKSKNKKDFDQISKMAIDEKEHLDYFDNLARHKKIKPTKLKGLFGIGAYAMGVGTALMGAKAAYVCTEAVEEIIEQHYQKQIDQLGGIDEELKEKTQGLPIVYYIRAGLDGEGSKLAIDKILTGLRWKQVLPPLIFQGTWSDNYINQVEECILLYPGLILWELPYILKLELQMS